MRCVALLVMLGISSMAGANSSSMEREALARIAQELRIIQGMVAKAKTYQGSSAVRRFRYEALTTDMNAMIEGIQTHLHRPTRLPKRIEPLVLEYQ